METRRLFGICCTAGLALAGGGLVAADEIPATAIYADLSVKNAASYKLGDGSASAAPTNGSDVVVTALYNGNTSPNFSWKLHSLFFDADRTINFWTDGTSISVGAGGITFLKNSVYMVGRQSESDRRLTVTADQEWRGLATDPGADARPVLSIGHFYEGYYRMGLGVASGVTQLAITRCLDVMFMGQQTQMGNLDLTVRAPARLRLVWKKGNPFVTTDGRLGCRSLTLEGDGDLLELGAFVATPSGDYTDLATELDAAHFAPVLNLTDGADIAMHAGRVNPGTPYEGTFAIPRVNVTKPAAAASDGVSTVTGTFTVTQELTTVTFAGSPTIDFTGATLKESDVSAGWLFTGAGTAKFSAGTYGLTGGLRIEAGAKASFAGSFDLTPYALSGTGGELVLDPGADGTCVLGDLAQFAGTVTVKSGQAIFRAGTGSATVVEDGGSKVVSGGMVVTDELRTEVAITVPSGAALKIYGNGLTPATTVILDGGSIEFGSRDTTVRAPILVTRASRIVSGASGTTNAVCAFVTCAITNAVTGGLCFDGEGCTVLAGGARFALPGETWWEVSNYNTCSVKGGSLVLTSGDYDMGVGPLALSGPDEDMAENWGKYLGIRDGASVRFADRKSGLGASRTVISVKPPRDTNEYNRRKNRLEVGAGGSLEIPWNANLEVGNNQSYAELVLSGGEITLNKYGRLTLGHGGYCTGELRLLSGTLNLNVPIRHLYADDVSRILWTGGTIRLGANFTSTTLLTRNSDATILRSCCQILGDGCVLDLGDCPLPEVTNTVAGIDYAEWIGAGTLTVRGGTTCKALAMVTFPSDIRLRLENGARVTVAPDAMVYDSAKSQYGWRRPYGSSY